MTATDLDTGNPRALDFGHQKVGSNAAQGFGQHDGCTAVQYPEGLFCPLIHRHRADEEPGADGGYFDAQVTREIVPMYCVKPNQVTTMLTEK